MTRGERPAGRGAGSGSGRVRLALLDDHEVYRIGLRTLLERTGGVEVLWDTASPHEAWDRIAVEPVDAVLIDVNLGGPVDGIEATRTLLVRAPDLRVIVMSGMMDERRLVEVRDAGAVGFLPKELSASEMLAAIRTLVVVAPAGRARDRPRPAFRDERGSPIEPLSPREREVLAEIRLGLTNREIADKLQVSTTTVNKHVHHVLRKLRVRNRSEAAIVAGALLSRPWR